MGCCTYVPKFPTWNLPIKIWKWMPALGHHARELPDITGQIQAQEQNAAVGSAATAWMRYQKTSDRLRDGWDYGDPAGAAYDAVSFLLPSGREVFYKVREVQGISLGFPNSHMVATLAKLSSIESNDVKPPYPPIDPDPPSIYLSVLVAYPISVNSNGIATTAATLVLKYADGSPVIGETVTITTTGSPTITGSPVTTDSLGIGQCTATNTVNETTHFEAVIGSGTLVSNDVVWSGTPIPPCEGIPVTLTVATPGANTCDSGVCAALAGTWALSPDSGSYSSDDEFALCGGYDHLKWYVSCTGEYWTARMSDPVMGTICIYLGPSGAGIGAGLVLTLNDTGPLCSFPATVTLLP